MLQYERFFLDNGLEVIIHPDHNSKIAVFNLLYKVGSRNEVAGKTGLAHFFEHLMFGSSANVPVFDRALERVGGSCNAFTSPDITNYYMTLPASNLETAFWLESDRMLQLTLTEKTIETQRKVVLEEYKQRYLNQPYGDVWHHMRDMAFLEHSYRWPTIGQRTSDIEEYTQDDVWDFYKRNYAPNNAILVIGGAVNTEEVKQLANKWFGPIPAAAIRSHSSQKEPEQQSKRTREVNYAVPTDALYKAFKMPGKSEKGYLEADLITDYLGFGKSSILEQRLIKNGKLFASAGAYVLGSLDPGLLIFSGKMEQGVSAKEAEQALDEIIGDFLNNGIPEKALQKIKNQGEAMKTYESIQLINRVMNLAFYANLGHPDLYWQEFEIKSALTSDEIMERAKEYLIEEQASVLYYQSEHK
ncbi:pitrilysin family protein [Algoriphagus sp. CAU 1675]|uniref:M16 family metallopeptidase n=1 Tax=Algoriphagus sp. CAU 1675 TaxID=3032597 RepID=UPI0023DB3CA8|nr:pitrilysin family protein [Algoriphagus sp. CAU 1675]MDF2156867.1 pitrilysin family protein [Algoriphagus sp. CAU 1675]